MSILKTISVCALAVLVLLSSSSFMVGVHLCAGELQDLALFSPAEKCAMEKNLPPCHQHLPAPCCDDETIVHEGDGFEASFADISAAPAPAADMDVPVVVIAEIIPDAPYSKVSYRNYDPPLRSYDLTVTHQVFLI